MLLTTRHTPLVGRDIASLNGHNRNHNRLALMILTTNGNTYLLLRHILRAYRLPLYLTTLLTSHPLTLTRIAIHYASGTINALARLLGLARLHLTLNVWHLIYYIGITTLLSRLHRLYHYILYHYHRHYTILALKNSLRHLICPKLCLPRLIIRALLPHYALHARIQRNHPQRLP